MKKRILSLALAGVLCLSTAAPALAAGLDQFGKVNTYAAGQFADVPADAWYAALPDKEGSQAGDVYTIPVTTSTEKVIANDMKFKTLGDGTLRSYSGDLTYNKATSVLHWQGEDWNYKRAVAPVIAPKIEGYMEQQGVKLYSQMGKPDYVYYEDYNWVPDFGALYGVTLKEYSPMGPYKDNSLLSDEMNELLEQAFGGYIPIATYYYNAADVTEALGSVFPARLNSNVFDQFIEALKDCDFERTTYRTIEGKLEVGYKGHNLLVTMGVNHVDYAYAPSGDGNDTIAINIQTSYD